VWADTGQTSSAHKGAGLIERVRLPAAFTLIAAAFFCGCDSPVKWMGARAQVSANAHAPGSDVALLEKAVSLVVELRYDEAEALLADLRPRLEASGDRIRSAEALFWHGYCLEKRGRIPLAVDLYRQTTQRYPETRAAERALDRLDILEPMRQAT